MSGKSNSVSGNYTCRVGLVQTQLRCKTRGATCIHRLPLSTPLTHRCVVHCSNPPHFHSLSPSLSLFPLTLPFFFWDKNAAAPSVWEDKNSPAEKIPHGTLPPAVCNMEGQLSEKMRDCIPMPYFICPSPSLSRNASWIHTLHVFEMPAVLHEK